MAAPTETRMATDPTPTTTQAKADSTKRSVTQWTMALLFEAALIAALLMAYRWVRYLLDGQTARADDNAAWVWHIERVLHLPSELAVQHWALSWEPLSRLCNLYYLGAHFPATALMLAWLFVFKSASYARVRLELILLTGFGLIVHALFPLTPPRLAPHLSFIDTMQTVGPSAYPPGNEGIANQYAAMPSLHVGWAILVALVVTRVATSSWRWVVWLHPTLTIFVVIVTANHYWLDGIVATAMLLAVIGCVSSRVFKRVEELQPSMATGSP